MFTSKTLLLEKGNYKLYKCSAMASTYFLVEGENKRYIRRSKASALAVLEGLTNKSA
jgi:hypothetical protein